jgi:pteridine reductase
MSSGTQEGKARVALVTGAAARIGAAVATGLHARGCDLVLHFNANREGADALASRLNEARPGSAVALGADLSVPAEIEELADQVRASHDRLDILVNNASRFYPTPLGETRLWQWDDLINSNLRGPWFLVQALLPELRTAGGAIVNIIDVHGERPMPAHGVYCISKAGLAMMTRALAAELGPAVRVNGVSPGAILWPEREPGHAEKQDILGRTALGRLGEAADIASAVAYLALDAPYVTGQVLAVDGGASLDA